MEKATRCNGDHGRLQRHLAIVVDHSLAAGIAVMEPAFGNISTIANANKFTGESSSTVGPFNADIDRVSTRQRVNKPLVRRTAFPLGRSSEQRAGERCREATRKTVILMNGDKPGLAEPTGRSSSLPVSPWAAPEKN
ncbi:hypothetical protein T01_8555 [Trichinella spiralis]|uniref:Uncharacterized protein n=1 Tax=Trichinella spiralis TaxID=6334 RepID=A0A0V1B5N9_TRISP|nr:hypothetical protein T01_8555 [Trichinella spiralis]